LELGDPTGLRRIEQTEGRGDVTWFDSLKTRYEAVFTLEHWGHTQLLALFLESPTLCLYYYPELVDEGKTQRKTITDTRTRYDKNLLALYRDLQFVGMSVYKQEATRGVAIHEIYIPLTIVPEAFEEEIGPPARINPLSLLESGTNNVVLGDPGSGKSTLLRFLALCGMSKALQDRYEAKSDKRLPVFVVLRKYADELRKNADLSLLDYIIQSVQADFSLRSADMRFFEYYLETGQTILFFDGLDELPTPHLKEIVRDRIRSLLLTYPGSTSFITSRIVGYENPFRFDDKEFRHFRLSSLQLPEIEQFVRDWYRVRVESKAERERNVADLTRIIRDDDHIAIRQLAENPLLLTIVALVHRIDAVLPDERVVLYQKCTETLLNTWHTWKSRETEQRNRGRVERRNRARMEAIAHWMQSNSDSESESVRAVSSYEDLHHFLVNYISESEKPSISDQDPQDSATDFLDFVRRKAGLLIEAGDQKYSFVHLTFQEYLILSL
jgi:predicted NACHT family NTPase